MGALLAGFVFAVTDGVLLFFTYRYHKGALVEGTPFAASGADEVRNLGIKTIVMPLAAVVISASIYACFGLSCLGDRGKGLSLTLGVALTLSSLCCAPGDVVAVQPLCLVAHHRFAFDVQAAPAQDNHPGLLPKRLFRQTAPRSAAPARRSHRGWYGGLRFSRRPSAQRPRQGVHAAVQLGSLTPSP